jgi:threonine dehydrogenase-like Zn-dependent dehydrogenase
VRLEGCGVCASSLPLWEGRPWFRYPLEPGAPGHEGWGVEVVSGRRVALLSQHAFAEYEVVPARHAVPLPPELDGQPFPGEALGCAMNVFARSGVRAGDDVAIVGAGFLGLLLVQLCVDAGARVAAFTRRASGLEAARRHGASTPGTVEDERFDVAIEAAGAQETLDLAARLCRTRGRLVVAGYHQDGARSVDMQLWNWRGLDVVNAHEREPEAYLWGIRQAAAAVAAGRLDPSGLYTHVLPLDHLDDAFRLLQERPEGFVTALVVTGARCASRPVRGSASSASAGSAACAWRRCRAAAWRRSRRSPTPRCRVRSAASTTCWSSTSTAS